MDIFTIRQQLASGKTIFDLPLRVTYYARVSTEKDAQMHSLSAQVEYYESWIRQSVHWQFVPGYVDEGISATSAEKREQFMKMIEAAGEGHFDFIVTKEISRFSRNTLDSIRYTQQLLRSGVGVLFQSDNINTLMPDAELRLTILSSIAQDEVRKISERVRFGFQRAIERGVVLGNDRIWGYDKTNGRLTVNEGQAEIVRLIFDLYANENMGIRAVARELTSRGFRNTRGDPFSFSTIRGILTNPKYKGWYCAGKSSKYDFRSNDRKHFTSDQWVMYPDEEKVPALVSESTWEKANRLLASRSDTHKRPSTGTRGQYPYSGLIFCGEHHQPCYRSSYRSGGCSREVWQCRFYSREGKKGCNAPHLYSEEIHSLIGPLLEYTGVDLHQLMVTLIDLYGQLAAQNPSKTVLHDLEQKTNHLKRRKDRLLELNMDGRLGDEEFQDRNEQLNQELWCLEEKKRQLSQRGPHEYLPDRSVFFQALSPLDTFPDGVSQQLARTLLRRVEICPDSGKGRLHILVQPSGTEEVLHFQILRRRGKPSLCSRQYI